MTEVDIYVQPKKNDISEVYTESDIEKVTSGTCSCPPPPTIENVKLGSASCEDPKKKICEVTFDITLADTFDEAKVYAIALNTSVDAPENYADFHALVDKEPDPRVSKKFTSDTTGGNLTRNITYGQDGKYKIYVGGKTKGGWFSDIVTLDACECPKTKLSAEDDDAEDDDDDAEEGLPTWAIVVIIIVSLLICVIFFFFLCVRRRRR